MQLYGPQNDIGLVGLGVMGRNLVLNMADHGFGVAVFNRTEAVTREFATQLTLGQRVQLCYSLNELVGALATPRRVMIMVKAGGPVDAVIEELVPLLEPGDILIDGGNSHFKDTQRRERSLAARGLHFLGVGVSGGEIGARTGPSLMPGGSKEAYESVQPVLEAIAARVEGEPCVSYLGPGAAGHYVKMVHNGIEYGLMQLIAESYALLKQVLRLSNEELASTYQDWSAAELESYLVGITADIFRRRDERTGGYLVDLIRAEADQLGTGMWASQSAMDLQVPVPNIDAAVAMRNLSALEEQRRAAADLLEAAPADAAGVGVAGGRISDAALPLTVDDVRGALYAGMVATYAQGFSQLETASRVLEFGLQLERAAFVWRGGCIIRSALLQDIRAAFQREPTLPSLLLDPTVSQAAASRRHHLERAVHAGVSARLPLPGLMAALAYLDTYRARWLPLNLVQAQRDYFGAHSYRRADLEGVFHTNWLSEGDKP